MPNARQKAIKKVVDAYNVQGPDPVQHEEWKARLHQPLPDGWPALAEALDELTAVEQETARGNKAR